MRVIKGRLSEVSLANGLVVRSVVNTDADGSQRILRMEIEVTDLADAEGITAIKLRGIRIQDLLASTAFNETTQADELALQAARERRLERVKHESKTTSGRTPFPRRFYAEMAWLYLDFLRTDPRTPTASLARALGVPTRTVSTRLAKAKDLGLLTTQTGDRPSGRAGAKRGSELERALAAKLSGEEAQESLSDPLNMVTP